MLLYAPVKSYIDRSPRYKNEISGLLEGAVYVATYLVANSYASPPNWLLPFLIGEYAINQVNRIILPHSIDVPELKELAGFMLAVTPLILWRVF